MLADTRQTDDGRKPELREERDTLLSSSQPCFDGLKRGWQTARGPSQCAKEAEIAEQSNRRRSGEYGGLMVDQATRLKDLQQDNGNLKRLVELRPTSLQLTSVYRFDFKLASESKIRRRQSLISRIFLFMQNAIVFSKY